MPLICSTTVLTCVKNALLGAQSHDAHALADHYDCGGSGGPADCDRISGGELRSGMAIWDFINNQLALSGYNFKALKVWTLLSYGFFHAPQAGSIFFIPIPQAHLVINMLMLFVLGRNVEPVLGGKRFLALYLGGILAGGLLYAVLHFNSYGVVIGASAAVSAVFGFFARINPNAQMFLIPIPIPIRVKWLLYGYIGITLMGLANELSNGAVYDQIAHSAHLAACSSAWPSTATSIKTTQSLF